MSDQVMDDARDNHLRVENEQLKTNIQHLSAQLRAHQQCVQEYLQANINLRASGMVLEENIQRLSVDNTSLIDRLHNLETEYNAIKKKYDEIAL